MEAHVLVPRLDVGTDHDLPVRHLGQDTPSERQRLLHDPARAFWAERLAAKRRRDRPQPEDPPGDRRGLQVDGLGGREGYWRWRSHREVVVLVHLPLGDEPVQELIAWTALGVHVAVPRPG